MYFDLTDPDLCTRLGTSREELVSPMPSRFIVNAKGKTTPTQDLGTACYLTERISALKVPSAAHSDGFCLDIFPERLFVGERVAIRDEHHRLRDEIDGKGQLHKLKGILAFDHGYAVTSRSANGGTFKLDSQHDTVKIYAGSTALLETL